MLFSSLDVCFSADNHWPYRPSVGAGRFKFFDLILNNI